MTKVGPKEAQRRAMRDIPRRPASAVPSRARSADPGAIIAPPGECEYCDRRRAHTRDSVARSRQKAKKAAAR